ncbi:hypothetical protein AVEN_102554-1 [Araneus ventricosus]|uniref:Uncharacterized protein n=1 Tax=Araneus ventricosus TaxID=182803 RepID=A0A4Y2BL71_ARAVE|nr:hypothetical protein AVEN_102554-1 [Araneus ventricosus]
MTFRQGSNDSSPSFTFGCNETQLLQKNRSEDPTLRRHQPRSLSTNLPLGLVGENPGQITDAENLPSPPKDGEDQPKPVWIHSWTKCTRGYHPTQELDLHGERSRKTQCDHIFRCPKRLQSGLVASGSAQPEKDGLSKEPLWSSSQLLGQEINIASIRREQHFKELHNRLPAGLKLRAPSVTLGHQRCPGDRLPNRRQAIVLCRRPVSFRRSYKEAND